MTLPPSILASSVSRTRKHGFVMHPRAGRRQPPRERKIWPALGTSCSSGDGFVCSSWSALPWERFGTASGHNRVSLVSLEGTEQLAYQVHPKEFRESVDRDPGKCRESSAFAP